MVASSTALAPLIGLDVTSDCLEDSSHAVTLHPSASSPSAIKDYGKLCSFLCAYRTFEVLALDGDISYLQAPIHQLPPLAFSKSNWDSSSLTVPPFMYIFSLS